jgi:hypothetical protein
VRRALAAAVLWTALAAQTIPGSRYNALYEKGREYLEPAGIDRQTFEAFSIWSEGQYVLGYCSQWLALDDTPYYRNWWKGSVIPQSEAGRQMLAMADQIYEQGRVAGFKEKPSREVCAEMGGVWVEDFRKAVGAEEEG